LIGQMLFDAVNVQSSTAEGWHCSFTRVSIVQSATDMQYRHRRTEMHIKHQARRSCTCH
jgi:hypothetical protein